MVCLLLCAVAKSGVDDYKSVDVAWASGRARPDFYPFAALDTQNWAQLDAKSHCSDKSPGTLVRLVFMMGAGGRIATYRRTMIPTKRSASRLLIWVYS